MRKAIVLAVGVILAFGQPQPVQACSFSWKPGWSPDEIKVRDDVRRVKGTFRLVEGRGELDEKGNLARGTIYGRIETERSTGWDTFHPYDQFLVECGAYRRPTADVVGTFWISRSKTDGRYEIVLWEGRYRSDLKESDNQESNAQ